MVNGTKLYGYALIASSILLIFTMVMHPAGGSLEHLVRIRPMIILTHSVGIIAMPFCLFGFWGLTSYLKKLDKNALLAFCFSLTGIVAGVIAAAINGLALPLYLSKLKELSAETMPIFKIVLAYNISLNHAFDFVFIGGISLALLIYSLIIVRTKLLPLWLGALGILLFVFAAVSLIGGFSIVHLSGFRLFVLGFTCWNIILGALLLQKKDL